MSYKVIEFWHHGVDWIIKQTPEDLYFHRVANSAQPWQPGLPECAVPAEIELMFLDAEEQTEN